jgi:hypothetical protein
VNLKGHTIVYEIDELKIDQKTLKLLIEKDLTGEENNMQMNI